MGRGEGEGCTHATRKIANGDGIHGDRSFRQLVVTFAYVLLSRLLSSMLGHFARML